MSLIQFHHLYHNYTFRFEALKIEPTHVFGMNIGNTMNDLPEGGCVEVADENAQMRYITRPSGTSHQCVHEHPIADHTPT